MLVVLVVLFPRLTQFAQDSARRRTALHTAIALHAQYAALAFVARQCVATLERVFLQFSGAQLAPRGLWLLQHGSGFLQAAGLILAALPRQAALALTLVNALTLAPLLGIVGLRKCAAAQQRGNTEYSKRGAMCRFESGHVAALLARQKGRPIEHAEGA
jgi:hypothetical protein